MDNNFENNNTNNENNENIEKNRLNKPEAGDDFTVEKEAEHVISYRESDTAHTYHMTGDQIVKDDIKSESKTVFEAPRYNATYTENGDATFVPAAEKQKKSGKGSGGIGGKIVLVAVCVLLSFGCGIMGAFFGNYLSPESASVGEGDDTPVINDKISTLEGEIASLEEALADPDLENKSELEAQLAELEAELSLLKDGTKLVVVERPVDRVDEDGDLSSLTYADVAANVKNSVVAITTEYKVVSYWQEYVTGGAGSGVVMSEDGYIITNYHVVSSEGSYYRNEYADTIKVSFENGKEYDAEVIGGSSEDDIAVLKITPDEGEKFTPVIFADSDKLKVGDEVMAVGNPLGELSGTATNGIISALAREVVIENVTMKLLQTNAAVNPGNSGGGLFNMKGELIGVVNAKSSGEGIEGLGFAIPSNDALRIAKEIVENGGPVVETPEVLVGIEIVTIQTAADAKEFGVNAYGVYVSGLEEGYNDNVLKIKDRIIAVDGKEIASGDDVVSIVREAKAGDKLEFIIYRDGRMKTVEVTVYPYDK
ncbi:MAG: trypsin-like peptidase domain-containing protein [Clostridia bacterium]|nr:trypsin-like peptidase domain-containing protein [Clostridia bacterium]